MKLLETTSTVDVATLKVVVPEEDCFATLGEKVKGFTVREIVNDGTVVESLENRLNGRFTVEAVKNPATGEVIVPENTMITGEKAAEIVKAGIKEVNIRSLYVRQHRGWSFADCQNQLLKTPRAAATLPRNHHPSFYGESQNHLSFQHLL